MPLNAERLEKILSHHHDMDRKSVPEILTLRVSCSIVCIDAVCAVATEGRTTNHMEMAATKARQALFLEKKQLWARNVEQKEDGGGQLMNSFPSCCCFYKV